MSARRLVAAGLAVLTIAAATRADGQALDDAPSGVRTPVRTERPGATAAVASLSTATSPALHRALPRQAAPIASLLLPGAGQLRLGQDRFVAYVAMELFVGLHYVKEAREARRAYREYRDLARDVARAPFGGRFPEGNWDYYERMASELYLESGRFSLGPSAAEVVPETDVSTFNGASWLLARQTYWTNPNVPPPRSSEAYQQALDFYVRRAYRQEYQWSWRNARLEQDLFRRSIARRNDSARRARSDVSLLLANHILSMLDAFVVLRVEQVRRAEPAAGELRVRGSLPWR